MDKVMLINKIAEYYKISKNIDFAKYFDISPQVAVAWIKTGGYNVYTVYKKCPDINPEWLLSIGEKGSMLRSDVQQAAEPKDESLGKALDNVREALERLAEEQGISKRVLDQTDRILKIIEERRRGE